VKGPRFRIASVMALIAIAAFDFTVIRRLVDYRTPTGDLLLVGAMPMANVLAVGMLIVQRRPGWRPFLLGFEAFGVVVLASFVFLANFRHRVLWTHVGPLANNLASTFARYGPFICISIINSATTVILVLPQVAFAVIGGFVCRKFSLTVTAR
jgi:hypothetical protein